MTSEIIPCITIFGIPPAGKDSYEELHCEIKAVAELKRVERIILIRSGGVPLIGDFGGVILVKFEYFPTRDLSLFYAVIRILKLRYPEDHVQGQFVYPDCCSYAIG